MTDITYTNKATVRKDAAGTVASVGMAGSAKTLESTVSVTAAAAIADTIKFGTIPSNARLSGLSEIHYDDLNTSTSALLDIGLASVDSNVTSDPDALNDGLTLTTAATGVKLIKDHANFGKQAWEFVTGLTEDPKGLLDVYGSITDDVTDATGDVTISLVYTVD